MPSGFQARGFFNPSYLARKCLCGKVFAFNVPKALLLIGCDGSDNALRTYVQKCGIGCNGVKLKCGDKQYMGTHVRMTALPEELSVALVKGRVYFYKQCVLF